MIPGVIFLVVVSFAADASAQTAGPPAAPTTQQASRPFEILDNSFFVEEAFNQERGVVQNIASFLRIGSGWAFGFTQEWPIQSQRHQFSYSIPVVGIDGSDGIGDVLINYRLQAMGEGPRRPAFAPRVSIVLPTGDPDRGTGDGVVGWQFNLPFSKQCGDLYFHWNAGLTVLPRGSAASGVKATLSSPSVAGSVIWRARPMINVMVEHVVLWSEQFEEGDVRSRTTSYTLSPGIRGGWNVGDTQIVVGVAAPVVWTSGRVETGGFLYFSYELPFRR